MLFMVPVCAPAPPVVSMVASASPVIAVSAPTPVISALLSLFPWSLCVGRLLSFLSVCVVVMLMVLFSVVVGSWWWYLHVSPNLQFPLWWYLQLILWSLLCFSFHSLFSWSILLRVLVMVFLALVAFSCFPVIMMVALFS